MVFSDTSSKTGIIQRCEDYTGIGDGNISGDSTTLKKFTGNVNEALYELIVEVMRSQDSFDWDDVNNSADYPIGKAALVAGQRDYTLPASLGFLTLKRLDVSWDGTNWYQASPIDSSEMKFGLGNDTLEDAKFELTKPRYDPKSDGFWLYPAATADQVTAGAKFRIEFTREFDEFTSADTTQEPPIDRPFHDLVAIGAALKWAVMKDQVRAQNLSNLLAVGIEKMKTYYGRRNTDAQLIFDPYIPNYK
jgi:hypothetical protein